MNGEYDFIALRAGSQIERNGDGWVSGNVPDGTTGAIFTVPAPAMTTFFLVEVGFGEAPSARYAGDGYLELKILDPSEGEMAESSKIYHTLSRLGYGPSSLDLTLINQMGLAPYIQQQLHPESISESDERLQSLMADSVETYRPGIDSIVVPRRVNWNYFKGRSTPPSSWRSLEFEAETADWLTGMTPIGRGFKDLGTQLDDMQQNGNQVGYVSVFMRIEFDVASPENHSNLILRCLYDDGFVAYLNGNEIARDNIEGLRPAHHVGATESFPYPHWEEFELDPNKTLLLKGKNVLAIQLHNVRRNDFDSLMDVTLFSREYQPQFERREVKGLEALQNRLHYRGIFSKRQLQAVLGEFWENHFTTDYDKVAEYLDSLESLEGRDVMPMERAEHEAAQMEYSEYEFFYNNALGSFGDLLLYSATSPSQLIYLDNVLNRVGEANENYAREILELFAFGVDNRYSQSDIEQLSRAFTGWQIRKVRPDRKLAFPDSALTPPMLSSFEPIDTPLFESGDGWRYFKGTRAPSRSNGQANLAWATPSFRDTFWIGGATPLGYDLDDPRVGSRIKTDVSSMRGSYVSIFLRREFTVESPEQLENLLLSIDYDDGYIAFLNGIEIARSETMAGAGRIPSHRFQTPQKHLASERTEFVDISRLLSRLRPAPATNVLAIEVHNSDREDTNFYIDARLVTRSQGEGSIELDDPNGLWTFRFNPVDHDYSEKLIFGGTEFEIRIPGNRRPEEGLQDALDVIRAMVDHPSTSEFLCLKLINRFVSDEISLRSYHERSADPGLLRLMDQAIQAWHATEPAGNIANVLGVVFSTTRSDNYFWAEAVHQAKVKTPIEYINSVVRALDWKTREGSLSLANESMGMHFFTRNDPDGWSEKGFDWMNTGGLLRRLNFSSGLPRLARNEYLDRWNVRRFLIERNLESANEIIDHFDRLLFEGNLSPAERNLFIQFANTKPDGNPSLFRPSRRDYLERAGDLIGLILSNPSLQFQ